MTVNQQAPTDAAILERARSLANEAVFTVALQRRRLRCREPEDEEFVFRWWADLQFLIVALRRLKRAAQLAAHVDAAVEGAIRAFDEAFPGLDVMRNVGEHVDDYARDDPSRHHKNVERRQLQVGTWDGTTYKWLGYQLNVDTALLAARELFRAVKQALELVSRGSSSSHHGEP